MVRVQFIVLIILLLSAGYLFAQNEDKVENLVQNPGFEQYVKIPKRLSQTFVQFNESSKYWTSPTGGSPDLYHNSVPMYKGWQDKGFGLQKARTGKVMAGITLYGEVGKKTHTREYLHVKLKTKLFPNERYYAEVWTMRFAGGLKCGNLGLYVSESHLATQEHLILKPEPLVNQPNIINNDSLKWVKISGYFTVIDTVEYLTIGNFFEDSLTQISPDRQHRLPFAYYYIDDVLIKKVNDTKSVPAEFVVNQVFQLQNILFDTDKTILLQPAFVELNRLMKQLEKYPNLKLEIRGHTDNVGTSNYNKDLSNRRAKNVAQYLMEQGVDARRITCKGFGYTKPVANNIQSKGRQLNRRVEFLLY